MADKQTEMIVLIDPPSGWRYGFPKVLPPNMTIEEILRWVVDSGYPQSEVDRGMMKHCRYIYMEAEKLNDA